MQEANVGKDKLKLVRLLQEHRVIVRGGGEEGRRLLTALLVGTIRPPLHCADQICSWNGAYPHVCQVQEWKQKPD